MAATTRTEITREVNNFYDKRLLFRAVPMYLYQKFAQIRDIPEKGGTNTIKFRRYSNLAAATTPLTEGTTPGGSQLSATEITATVAQYGDYVLVTDVVNFESPDKVLAEAADILGDQAGLTLDTLARDVYVAGTSVIYSDVSVNAARSDIASTDLITRTNVKKAVKTLKNNLARKLTMMVNPSTGIATTPIQACYVGIVHPNVTYTLKELTGWKSIETYAMNIKPLEGEVGSLDEVRFIESTNAKVFANGGAGAAVDVYATLVFGSDAFGATRISGQAMENIVKGLGSAGTADPLNQRASSGWKATFVAKILNNAFITRIETAAE